MGTVLPDTIKGGCVAGTQGSRLDVDTGGEGGYVLTERLPG